VVPGPPRATELDDRELLARIAEGKRDALVVLYQRHIGWITVRLERRCRSTELVDTAIQDTFLAVWKQADTYRPTGDVAAWIWTIAVRRLIDQMRKRPAPKPVSDVSMLMPVVAEEIPMALRHTPLGAAFGRLEPELQAVLAATAFDGLTNTEASTVLGIPPGTVKSRLARARAKLKEELQ